MGSPVLDLFIAKGLLSVRRCLPVGVFEWLLVLLYSVNPCCRFAGQAPPSMAMVWPVMKAARWLVR